MITTQTKKESYPEGKLSMNKILNSYTFKTILIIFVGIPILFIGIDYGYWFLNTDPLWPIKSTPIWSQKNSKYSRIPVLSVQFSPDGRILAYSSTKRYVQMLWIGKSSVNLRIVI